MASTVPASAQTGPGTYGASFLKIPVGARLVSSPDAVAGVRPDASLMYSNPAFIAGLESAGVFASSSRWMDDLSFNSIGTAIPVGKGSTVLGVGTSLLYSGGLEGYDESLNVISEEAIYDLAIDVVVAHRFGSLSAAAGATYIREHVLPEDGAGYAFQLGASYQLGRTLLHASARDLGGTINFASTSWPVAAEWTAGGARVFDSSVGQFVAGVQASSSDAYGTRLRLGVDYAINSVFTLRTGVNDNMDDTAAESRFNAGFGMRLGALSLEYAYAPQEYFSSAHTFSLGYELGAPERSRDAGITVPIGDLAPPVPDNARVDAPRPPRLIGGEFILVAGAHASMESARSEARALDQLNIPCEIATEGPRYRVIVGRYATFDAASQARTRYRAKGHEFQILAP